MMDTCERVLKRNLHIHRLCVSVLGFEWGHMRGWMEFAYLNIHSQQSRHPPFPAVVAVERKSERTLFFKAPSFQLIFLFCVRADMHHVKSEHEKDDDDDLDDDRKPELGHHGHHSYYQHPMTMGGHYNNHHHSLKSEIDTISKNQTGSDCGVPIPASKPKIWSLADTAACKTPPPHLHPNGTWGYQTTPSHQHPSQQQYTNHTDHQHQMQRQQSQYHLQDPQLQQQQMHMGQQQMMANGAEAGAAGMNMNMITSGHHNQSMSGMMNTFGGSSPYSRYGGFLTTGTHPIQQPAQQMPPGQQQYINHNHTGGSTTPVTPNSTGQPTTPTLQQQSNGNATSNNQTMGFPEVQTGKSLGGVDAGSDAVT